MIKRRTRILAGTLASAAMALSFTEAVVASTCAPMPARSAAALGEVESDGAVATRMFMAVQHHGDDADHEGGNCPFCSVMGQCWVPSVSLPAVVSVEIMISPLPTAWILLDEVPPYLLLTH